MAFKHVILLMSDCFSVYVLLKQRYWKEVNSQQSTVDQCKISLNLTSKALDDLQSPQMAQKIKLVSKNGAKRRSLIDSNSAESNCG